MMTSSSFMIEHTRLQTDRASMAFTTPHCVESWEAIVIVVNRWGDLVTSLSSDACVGVQLYLPERDVLVADAAHARFSGIPK